MSSSRGSRRPSHRRARGQGLVEFAFVAPILIGLAFGIFDFGRALSANVTVTNSSREGARYIIANAATSAASFWTSTASCQSASGTVAPAANTGEAAAWRQLQGASLDLSKVSMTIYFYSTDPAADLSSTHAGALLTIKCPTTGTATSTPTTPPSLSSGYWVLFSTTYQYVPVTPLISHFIGNVTVTQTTTMVIE